MLVYLSFLVCAANGACHVTVPVNDPYVGLVACQIAGEQNMPTWERAHPGMYVSKVRCSIGTKPVAQDNA
jgi:hypothetical protein